MGFLFLIQKFFLMDGICICSCRNTMWFTGVTEREREFPFLLFFCVLSGVSLRHFSPLSLSLNFFSPCMCFISRRTWFSKHEEWITFLFLSFFLSLNLFGRFAFWVFVSGVSLRCCTSPLTGVTRGIERGGIPPRSFHTRTHRERERESRGEIPAN